MDGLIITFLAVVCAVTAAFVIALVLQRRAHGRREQNLIGSQEDLVRELDEAREAHERTRAELARALAKAEETSLLRESAEGHVEAQRVRAREFEQQAAGLRQAFDDVRDRLNREEQALRTARLRIERARQRHEALEAWKERTTTLLESLSIPLEADGDARPCAPEARMHTRQHLSDLVVSTGAAATALTDERGLDLLGTGPQDLLNRLGRLSGWTHIAEDSLRAALRTPVRVVSAALFDGGLHIQRLSPEGSLWLGIAGPYACPRLALRLSTARLAGTLDRVPEPTWPSSSQPPTEGDDGVLARFAARWGIRSVALVDGHDEVIACSEPALADGLQLAAEGARPWFRRLQLQSAPVRDAELRAESFAGTHLAIRALETGPEGLIAVALSDAELPADALDELRGLARYNRLRRDVSQRELRAEVHP